MPAKRAAEPATAVPTGTGTTGPEGAAVGTGVSCGAAGVKTRMSDSSPTTLFLCSRLYRLSSRPLDRARDSGMTASPTRSSLPMRAVSKTATVMDVSLGPTAKAKCSLHTGLMPPPVAARGREPLKTPTRALQRSQARTVVGFRAVAAASDRDGRVRVHLACERDSASRHESQKPQRLWARNSVRF